MLDFGTATLDLNGKADFRSLFQELVPKLTEFWNQLDSPNLDEGDAGEGSP
ncbi:hypothetical protein FACS189476_11320 [Spirochaetia bacterium]|nr:hypothetical protein FACS189476_11320 [Spirochaetia bacterium]